MSGDLSRWVHVEGDTVHVREGAPEEVWIAVETAVAMVRGAERQKARALAHLSWRSSPQGGVEADYDKP